VKDHKQLQNLTSDIFACFLQSNYEDNLYLYEHRIHTSKAKCIPLPPQQQRIFNGLLDCGLLRWRVKDKSVFQVCHNEMVVLANTLKLSLTLKKNEDALSSAISAFENIYQNVLAVTAKEPLAFLLFIASLKVLKEACFASQCTASA